MFNPRLRLFSLLFLLAFFTGTLSAQPSPSEYLGYAAGSTFTLHHQMTGYFEEVARQSDRVMLRDYGKSWEDRRLFVAFVSSARNLARIDAIRQQQQSALAGNGEGGGVAVVWLSFGVHGDEASSTEAAMEVLFRLAGGDAEAEQWLEHTLVIIDPCLNPDGRERYVNWYLGAATDPPSVYPESREHNEPWPGSRYNHYQFDLNRDWAWATQRETRNRLALYNDWLPHVHIDFHEQEYTANYYFGPAVEPYHEQISDWQREFQELLAVNHRRHFDARGWLYFSRERFDLLYPGYGDTYPMLNGAIGITYEAPGGVGLQILLPSGDTLQLAHRIERHVLAALSTVEASAQHRERLLREFSAYFRVPAASSAGQAYVFRASEMADLTGLRDFFRLHGIRSGFAVAPGRFKGTHYGHKLPQEQLAIEARDLVVPLLQPKHRLLHTLMETETRLEESRTYDITSWNLPYAHGLETYVLTETPAFDPDAAPPAPAADPSHRSTEPVYAYLADWNSAADARMLTALLSEGVRVRRSALPFSYGDRAYGPGSLVITQSDNRNGRPLADRVEPFLSRYPGQLVPVYSGSSTAQSLSLGSGEIRPVQRPRVLLASGPETWAENFGELWYCLEGELGLAVTVTDVAQLGSLDLRPFTAIVLPSGRYGSLQEDEAFARLRDWVAEGGVLILVHGAIDALSGENRFAARRADITSDSLADIAPVTYADRHQTWMNRSNLGVVLQLEVDNSHPLGYGYGREWHALFTGNRLYEPLQDGWNVAASPAGANPRNGVAGEDFLRNLPGKMFIGAEQHGAGHVVYFPASPVYRAFWRSGLLFLANAIYLAD